jgi:hypothetical protein
LYERGKKIIFYIDCRRTNGTTMLKLAHHDSRSGEHIEINYGMIVTSGKSLIWPIAAPKIKNLEGCEKTPREGKIHGQN